MDIKYKIDWVPEAKKQRQLMTQKEPTGIGSKSEEVQDTDQGFYQTMYDTLKEYFSDNEEADKVLTSKEIDRDAITMEALNEFDSLERILTPEDQETPQLDFFLGEDIEAQDQLVDKTGLFYKQATESTQEVNIPNEKNSSDSNDSNDSNEMQSANGKVTDLLNFIGEGEGGYESAHSGTIGGVIQNSTSSTTRDGKKLTELTIGEIKEYMKLDIKDKDRLFAVGKFQFIPDTFNLVVEKMDLSDDKVFTPELQEEMGTYLLTDKVGRKLQTWLYQDDTTIKKSNVNEAMLALAKEFASVPVPFDIPKNPNPTPKNPWPKVDLKAGDSYYKEVAKGGNSAQHTIEETKDMLMKVKGTLKMKGQVTESMRPRIKPAGTMERPPL